MVKECGEEANITPKLASKAIPTGMIQYCWETNEGLRREILYNYDLLLKETFQPENTDGEVEAFYLQPVEHVAEKVEKTEAFKTNCNLVVIDYLIRHGKLTPEMPDYFEIAQGLHSPFPLSDR